MRSKNQQVISSEDDAKEKLIVYVYEYLTLAGAKQAACMFKDEMNYTKDIKISQPEGPGFLSNWWCVFWDLYCAAPERRGQIEPSHEARAFNDYNSNMRSVMSPSVNQTSPPGHGDPPFMVGGGPMMAGPRYGPPHMGQLRGGPINMGPRGPPMSQGPPPPHPPMMGSPSPRYAPHPGHMTPGSSASSGPMIPEPGPSPGINRATPNHSSSPHPQPGPPNAMSPMSGPPGPQAGHHIGLAPGQQMGPGGPMQHMQQRLGPAPPPIQNWQGNFNVNSPADQQCFMPGPPNGQQGDQFGNMMMNDGSMMDIKPQVNNGGPRNQQQDEYVMPGAYGQQGDQSEAGAEILKLKESLESETKEYNEGDQDGFGPDVPCSQNKW